MKIFSKNLIPTILIVFLPLFIGSLMFDSFSFTFLETLGEKIKAALERKISGVESQIEWFLIFKYIFIFGIGYYLLNHYMKKREFKAILHKVADVDIILFLWNLFKITLVYGSMYGFVTWSEINTTKYFESSNLILLSVFMGLIIKIIFFAKKLKVKD